ncbi:MAG: hypothetical protein ACPGXZ_06250 [Saprospiraceae bacterium]
MKKLTTFLLLLSTFFLHGQTMVTPYPDNSWDAKTYTYLGVPSLEKKWKKSELRQFLKYMEKIYIADKWSLPRKNSPYSGDVFKKMTSFELLKPINDATIQIDERIDYINTQFEYSNFLLAIYQEKDRKTERFGREVLAGYNFLLASTRCVRNFMDELTKTLPPNATAQPEFKKMYNQSTSQVVTLINLHIEIFQKDWGRYDSDVISNFAPTAFEGIDKSWSLLSSTQQKTLISKITILKKHELKPIRKAAKSFLKEKEF